jgi:hypothetical protein
MALCARVPDMDIYRMIGDQRLQWANPPNDWVDNMCIYTNALRVLRWIWPNMKLWFSKF